MTLNKDDAARCQGAAASGPVGHVNDAAEPPTECPETAYRRGFQQGAYEALYALETGLPHWKVMDWALTFKHGGLAHWRYRQQLDRRISPPRLSRVQRRP